MRGTKWSVAPMVASLVAMLVVVASLAATPAGAEPTARRAASPVLDRPAPRSTGVVFSGRARPRAVVRLQVRGNRWITLRSTRAARNGAYRLVTTYPKAVRAYRVVSGGRSSAIRRVGPKAQPAPAPSDACGVRPKRADGSHYSCTMVEEFDGTELDPTRWVANNVLEYGDICFRNDAPSVEVSGGTLQLRVAPATEERNCPLRPDGTRGKYVSGWISTFQRWSQQYGRIESRMKVQDTDFPGLHEGFWMWPDIRYGSASDWPNTGEIDIAETYSSHPDLMIPFLHYSADSGGAVNGLNTAWNCTARRGQWHRYALEWTADRLEFQVDGKTCLVNTDGAETFRKRFTVAFTQLLGNGVNAYDGRVPLPATMEVDWVKAWQ
ncbi:family 16 glycosylhydrolase [Nocardioides caeni]|uniref:Glycoside hydrolase family 16 protein n=1 Tax=Nocardioides caeni TaxID=574700 RepID=A0A4S8N418_9ACTN|nr:glycoside hydrolase family 16 protein [Nocardioides caeni]THV10790.1 glycoside hydrolase family 16 protein [Nocardioides caeni]